MLVSVCGNIRNELLCRECQQSFPTVALKETNENTMHANIQPFILAVKPVSLKIVICHLAGDLGHANIDNEHRFMSTAKNDPTKGLKSSSMRRNSARDLSFFA